MDRLERGSFGGFPVGREFVSERLVPDLSLNSVEELLKLGLWGEEGGG